MTTAKEDNIDLEYTQESDIAEKILLKSINNRCKYESDKLMSYDLWLAILEAMEEYAKIKVSEININEYI